MKPCSNSWARPLTRRRNQARRLRVGFHRAPFDSPPFPRLIGKLAGLRSSVIPVSWRHIRLMQAIYEGLGGQAWKDSKVQIYGWVNFSGNISTSHPSKTSENGNFPLIYDLRPNRMELNQIVLYLERLANEKSKRTTSIGVFESQPSTGFEPLEDRTAELHSWIDAMQRRCKLEIEIRVVLRKRVLSVDFFSHLDEGDGIVPRFEVTNSFAAFSGVL